jgi:hypothetical protein
MSGFLYAAVRLAIVANVSTRTAGFAISNGLTAPWFELHHHHQPCYLGRLYPSQNLLQQQRRILPTLNESGNEGDDVISNSSAQDASRLKRSIARAGGRKQKVNNPPPKVNTDNGVLSLLKQWAVPLLFIFLLMKFLFGGLFASSNNYVYYSRSVYQSTTYMRDGNVETRRKETFQSNVPGLVDRSKNGGGVVSIEDDVSEIEDELFDAFGIRGW